MKSRREWCELIAWTMAASLLAMQARFVSAAETSAGPAVSINRGETYVIKGASPGSRPEITSIDNPHALIVNVQPDGSVMVLGADAGTEAVRVTMADGHVENYTVTVSSKVDPANPLAGGGSAPPAFADAGATAAAGSSGTPAAGPLDPGTGPANPTTAATGSSATNSGGPLTLSSIAPSAAASNQPLPTTAPANSAANASAGSAVAAAAALNASDQISGSFSLGHTTTPSQMASQPSGTDPRGEALREASSEVVTHGTHYMPDDAITMMYGTSRVFDFPQRLRRVSIADTSIADLQVIVPIN